MKLNKSSLTKNTCFNCFVLLAVEEYIGVVCTCKCVHLNISVMGIDMCKLLIRLAPFVFGI